MPKFDVELIHPESGAKKTLLIEATDTEDVRQTAERMGYSLGNVAICQPKARRNANQQELASEEEEDAGVDLALGCRACGLVIALFGGLLIGWFTLFDAAHSADQGSQPFTGVLVGVMLVVIGIAGCIAARVVARR